MSTDPLSLWRDGAIKARILEFVQSTTQSGSPNYVPPLDRIAVFDNDGTLWPEQPMYTQLQFVLDTLAAMAPEHPEWDDDPALSAARRGDLAALAPMGMRGLAAIVMAVLAGKSTEQVRTESLAWIQQARHPRFGKRYTDLIYAPQLQLLAYLRANDYRPFIVSGGGIEFMRAFSEEVYGIRADQVIGSSVLTEYEVHDGRGALIMQPEIYFVDDGPGKPVGINHFIGRRPVIAIGNSDGDFEMLEYATSGTGPGLGVLLHHDDAAREYAYDRESPFGRLARGLDQGQERGWLLVSMQRDWAQVFAHESD